MTVLLVKSVLPLFAKVTPASIVTGSRDARTGSSPGMEDDPRLNWVAQPDIGCDMMAGRASHNRAEHTGIDANVEGGRDP